MSIYRWEAGLSIVQNVKKILHGFTRARQMIESMVNVILII